MAVIGPIELELRGLMGKAVPVPGSKPFADYTDIEDCIAHVPDTVRDKPAYCASIMRAVEGKDTPWMDEKPWKGDRVFEAFIGDPAVVDKQGERIPFLEYVKNLPFLVRYGFLDWMHNGEKIGEPLAWRIRDGKPEVRFGLIDPNDPTVPAGMRGELEGAWQAIKKMGKTGQTSVSGMWVKRRECDGRTCWSVLDDVTLWSVGWVAGAAANRSANVTATSGAKQVRDPSAVCGGIWFHGSGEQREAFGGGSEGRGPDEKPPAAWWDDCLAHVEKSSEPDLAAFVRGLPGLVRSLKASVLLANNCVSCVDFFDSAVDAGLSPKAALDALQRRVDRAVAAMKAERNLQVSATITPDPVPAVPEQLPTPDPKQTPPPEGAPDAAAMMAALQELAKRVEALEATYAAAQKTRVDAEKAVAAQVEAFGKFDERLRTLEAAARSTPADAGAKILPPPRDRGAGMTRKQLLELAAKSTGFEDFKRAFDAAAGGE